MRVYCAWYNKNNFARRKTRTRYFSINSFNIKKIETNNEYAEVIDFILKFLNFTGFAVELPNVEYVYFDKLTAEFVESRTELCMQIDKSVYHTLKAIQNGEKTEFNEKHLKQSLRLLYNVIINRFGTEIKTFEFLS